MTRTALRLTLVCLLFSWTYVSAQEFSFPEKLPEHPRMFLTKKKEADVKERMKTDPFLEKLVEELIKKADRLKNEPPSKYDIPDGLRLLPQSQRSVERTTTLAFAYRMTGKQEYADAAIAEMLTVCRFPDWNPRHFLDTSEMADAVGLGYDWLYDVIPAEKREEIKNAVLKLALQPALGFYKSTTEEPRLMTRGGWTTGKSNWNEVCSSGLLVGALAIADEERAVAESIVNYALKSMPNGLSAYKPDGGYPEGPEYWAFGAFHTGLSLMLLRDVFQNDFGFLETEGLNTTGDYYMSMFGPRYRSFNYADARDNISPSPVMFAFAVLYNRPDYTVWLRTFLEKGAPGVLFYTAGGTRAVFHALWYNPAGTNADFTRTPLARKFSGQQDVCSMRTSWTDPLAAYLAFKGGNNRVGHWHLDIGSFIYEVNGVRWAVDLGLDNYSLPGYFGAQRENYYRLNNRSHNTLVIGDKLQNLEADCKIVEFESGKEGNIIARAVADITDAYKEQVQSAKRTAVLYRDGSVEIEDMLVGVTEPVRWGMMTQATIELDGKTATLSQRDQKIRIELQSDYAEKFEMTSATPPTVAEKQNTGYSMLTVTATPKEGGHGQVHICVVINPL